MIPPVRRAFTLVELLVVISVIVVLMALLAPALDQAIYQAELTACGAKLDAFGSSLINGSLAHQRRYPTRLAPWHPISVNLSAAGRDDRPALRRYVGGELNDLLNDPLTKAVDIDGSKATTTVQTSYAMWFGWQHLGERSMRKLGDRWTFQGREFNIVAQDFVYRDSGQGFQAASHADHDYVLQQYAAQDASAIIIGDTAVRGGETTSFWIGRGRDSYGLMDLNVFHGDGSVQRHTDVKVHDSDERMTTVPRTWNGNNALVDWIRVPKQ